MKAVVIDRYALLQTAQQRGGGLGGAQPRQPLAKCKAETGGGRRRTPSSDNNRGCKIKETQMCNRIQTGPS